jgi:AbrB family looped-hinge helix DNA binding protein
MSNVVGERYQITIDKHVREQLGIEPGDRAVERVEDGRLVVEFIPRPHRDSLLGLFRDPGRPPITDWQEVRDRAWARRADELREVLEADSRRHREDG